MSLWTNSLPRVSLRQNDERERERQRAPSEGYFLVHYLFSVREFLTANTLDDGTLPSSSSEVTSTTNLCHTKRTFLH